MNTMVPFKLKAKKKKKRKLTKLLIISDISVCKDASISTVKKKSTRTGIKLVAAVTTGKEFDTGW